MKPTITIKAASAKETTDSVKDQASRKQVELGRRFMERYSQVFGHLARE